MKEYSEKSFGVYQGEVIVNFKASGDKHIMWNLFKWGYAVEILAPIALKSKYKAYIEDVMKKL